MDNSIKQRGIYEASLFFNFLSLLWFKLFPKKLIPYGKLLWSKTVSVEDRRYRIQEFDFGHTIASYHHYRKVVFQYAEKEDLVTSHYDLYDWAYTCFQFPTYTFRVLRYGNRLQCIKTLQHTPISRFELDAGQIIELSTRSVGV